MSNAAIYIHSDAYDTASQSLLGRRSAGESFLRGFLRHAEVERFHFYNALPRPQADLEALIARIEAPKRPVSWIAAQDRGALSSVGVLNMPVPEITTEAWHRRPHGSRSYAICGITHTTATATVMRIIPELLIAPLEDYDALICTSSAVREAVETQIGLMREYMAAEYGARRRPEPQRVTIPLGVNTSDFAAPAGQRERWREQLGIPQDGLVALYVGRFSVRNKMNPALMAMALERAARALGRPLWWVSSGWGESQKDEAHYHEETRKLCPSVTYLHVDGRKPDVRFSIWSVADVFLSFSDNIQETFGLTPIEAMAAGLPCVVSDWNGYKDTVRDGVDGFRVPTVAPRPGMGGDLGYWFSNNWLNYDNYVGATAQFTAVDLDAAEQALLSLLRDPDLRRRFGEAGQAQARQVFDWSAIIPRYQALWAEQDARRRAAPPDAGRRDNPFRPDPFTLFANYPTRHLGPQDQVVLTPGMTWDAARPRLDAPLAIYSRFNRPTHGEVQAILEHLAAHPSATVASILTLFPPQRRGFVERGLLWLARHDVVALRQGA
jgi:glycosyltransferase involved in cell wall biosynthesis